MVFIIVYILLLFVLFRFKYKNTLSSSLDFLYLLSAVSGLILLLFFPNIREVADTKSYWPLIILFPIVYMWIEPYAYVDDDICKVSISNRRFNKISIVLGLLYFPFTLLLFYNAVNILTTVDVSTYRVEENYYDYFVGGVMFTIGSWLAGVSHVPHILFFLSFHYNSHFIVKFLLFIASLSFVAITLCFAGRDGFVYWIFNSIILYRLIQKSLTLKTQQKLKKLLYIVSAIIISVFLFITVYRFIFSYLESESLFGPILSYIGQPIHVFSQSFALGLDEVRKLDKTSYLTYTFGTFVNGLWRLYGIIGLLSITIIHYLFVRQYGRVFNKKHCIYDFFIIYTFFQIPLYGVFYYRQSLQQLELTYLLLFIVCVCCKIYELNIIKKR